MLLKHDIDDDFSFVWMLMLLMPMTTTAAATTIANVMIIYRYSLAYFLFSARAGVQMCWNALAYVWNIWSLGKMSLIFHVFFINKSFFRAHVLHELHVFFPLRCCSHWKGGGQYVLNMSCTMDSLCWHASQNIRHFCKHFQSFEAL